MIVTFAPEQPQHRLCRIVRRPFPAYKPLYLGIAVKHTDARHPVGQQTAKLIDYVVDCKRIGNQLRYDFTTG